MTLFSTPQRNLITALDEATPKPATDDDDVAPATTPDIADDGTRLRAEALPLPPQPATDERPHVYVINSDPGFLEMIADLLADVRVHVTLEQLRPNVEVTAANLRSARPDLLILDLVPFHNDARIVLERMAEDETLREVPVLLASTSTAVATELANEFGDQVRDILPKPFDLTDFYTQLQRLSVQLIVP